MLRCPRCRGGRVRRSRYQLTDIPWVVLLLAPYRCRECGLRFHQFFWKAAASFPREPLRTPEEIVLLDAGPVPRVERRLSSRHPCHAGTACHPMDDDSVQWPAWIREISQSGITLLAERRFPRGTQLVVQVAQQVSDAPLVLEAEVVHVVTLTQG